MNKKRQKLVTTNSITRKKEPIARGAASTEGGESFERSAALGASKEALLNQLVGPSLGQSGDHLALDELEQRLGWRQTSQLLMSAGPQGAHLAKERWGQWLGDGFNAEKSNASEEREGRRLRLRKPQRADLLAGGSSPASPLPTDLVNRIHDLSGVDLSDVQLHRDSEGPQLAGAEAFTDGKDIFLGPDSESLLGHEAWHVVQQRQGRVSGAFEGELGLVNRDQSLEVEADVMGDELLAFGSTLSDFPESNFAAFTNASQPIGQRGVFQGAFIPGAKGHLVDDETAEVYEVIGGDEEVVMVLRVSDGLELILVRQLDGSLLAEDGNAAIRAVRLKERDFDPSDKALMDLIYPDEHDDIELDFSQDASAGAGGFAFNPRRVKGGPSMASDFVVQMEVIPVEEGQVRGDDRAYTLDQVYVGDVLVGNNDRPDTRFGAKQESHTVAWTLIRAVHQAMGNRPARELFDYYIGGLKEILADRPGDEATLLANSALILAETLNTATSTIDRWQFMLSRLATTYTQAYQVSASATFKKGRAVGHGESYAMNGLGDAEERLGSDTVDDEKLPGLQENAATLLDVSFNKSLGEEGVVVAITHWINAISTAFPRLFKRFGIELLRKVLGQGVPPGVTNKYPEVTTIEELMHQHKIPLDGSTLAPGRAVVQGGLSGPLKVQPSPAMDGGFQSNVDVAPREAGVEKEMTAQVAGREETKLPVVTYTAEQLDIRGIRISDKDRPDTRFGDRQMSHTVAWTLVREELTSFSGVNARELLTHLAQRLSSAQSDTDDPAVLALLQDALGVALDLVGSTLAIHQWQAAISQVVRAYTIVYQKLKSATYVDEEELGRALGHGEASHMARLRRNEQSLQTDGKLMDTAESVVASAQALLDVQLNSSLSAIAFVRAVLHWYQLLSRSFPKVIEAGGKRIFDELGARELPKGAQTEKFKTLKDVIDGHKDDVLAQEALFEKLKKRHRNPGHAATALEALNFTHHGMPGDQNDCAIYTLYHQLTTRRGLVIPNFNAFRDHIRYHAGQPMGAMIDIAAHGNALLTAANGYLATIGIAPVAMSLHVYARTADDGLLEYRDVATVNGGGAAIYFYFNGVNHFDSLLGDPPV